MTTTHLPWNGRLKTPYSSFRSYTVTSCSVGLDGNTDWCILGKDYTRLLRLNNRLIAFATKAYVFHILTFHGVLTLLNARSFWWALKSRFDETLMENSTRIEVTYLWFNGVSNRSNNRVSIVRSWIRTSRPISDLFFPLIWQILAGSCLTTDWLSVRSALGCQKSKNNIALHIQLCSHNTFTWDCEFT